MRVRDPLLEDLDYGPQVMAIRKRWVGEKF